MDNPENFRPEGLRLSESYAKSRNENRSLSERSISSAILYAKRALWPQHARKTGPLVDVKGEQKEVIGNQPLSGHSAVSDFASIPQQETSMTSAGNCKPMSQEDTSEQERIPTSKVERRSTTMLPDAELFKLRQHRLWAHRDSSCSPQGMPRHQVDQEALGLVAQRCVGQISSTSSDMPPGALPPPSSDYHNGSEDPSCTATTSSGGASMTQEGAHATSSHAMRLPRPSQTSLFTSSDEEDNTSGSDLSILTGSERSRLMRHPKTLRQHRLWRRRDSAASPQGRAQRCVKQLLVDIGASAIARRRRRAEQHVQTAKKAGVTDSTTAAGSTTGAGSTTSPLPSEASYPVSAQTNVSTLKYGSRPPDSETGTYLTTGSISGPTSQVCSTSLATESTELHAGCSAVVQHSMLGKLQRHRLWRGRDSAASPTGRAQKQVTEALKVLAASSGASPSALVPRPQSSEHAPSSALASHAKCSEYTSSSVATELAASLVQARVGSTGHTSSNASVAGTELASMISDMPSEASKLQIKAMESNSGNQLSSAAAAAAAASTLQRLRGHRLWKGRNSTASPEGRARAEVEQALQILAKEGVSKTLQLDSGVISSRALTSSHASSMQGRTTGLAFSQRDVVSSALSGSIVSEEAQPLDRAEGLLGSTQSMDDHASSVVQRHASSVVQRHNQVLIASPRGTVIKAGGETEEIGIQGEKKGAESTLPCMKHIGNDQGSSHSNSSSSNEGPLAAQRVRQALGRIRQHRLWKKRESSASPTGRARRQVEQALRLGLGGAVARRQKQLGVTGEDAGTDAPETNAASQTVQAAVLGTNAAAAAQRSRRRDDFTQSATSSQTPRTSAPGSSDITVMSNVMSYAPSVSQEAPSVSQEAPSVSQEATEDSHYDTRHLIVEPPQQLGSILGGRHQDLPRYRSVAESHLLPTPSSSMRTSTDGWTASEVTAAPASPSRLTPSDHALLMMKASAIDLPSSSVSVGSSLHPPSGDALSVLEQGRAARELTRRRGNEAEALRRLRKHRLWRERDSSASPEGRVRTSVEKALRLLLSQHQSQGGADPGQGAMIDAYASSAWESGSVSAVSGSQGPVIMAESAAAAAAAAASCAIPTNRTGGARMLSSILPTQGFKHVTAPIVAAEAPAPISPLAPSPPSLPSALDESTNQLLLRNHQGIILGRKDFHTSSIWDASAIAENQKMFESRASTGRSMYPGSTLHHNWQYSDWWLSRWSRDTPNPTSMNTQAAEEAELLHLWPSSEGGKQHPPEASTAISDAVGPGLFPGLSSALLGPTSIQAELAEQTLGTRHCLEDCWALQCTTPDVMLQQLPDERARHAAEASLSEVPMLVGSISTTRSSAPPLSRQVSDLSDRLRAIASSVAQYVLKSPAASAIPHPFAPNNQESSPRQRPTSTPGSVEREKLSGVHLEDRRLLQYHDPRKCASVSGIEEELDCHDKGAGPCSVLGITVTLQPGELATATLQPSDQVTASLPRTLPPAPPLMDQRVELPEIMPELVVAAAEVVVVSTAAATVSRRAKSLRANLDGFLSTLSEQLITMDHDAISTEEHVVKGVAKTLLVSDVHREENLSNGGPVGFGGAPDAAATAINDNGSNAIPNATDTDTRAGTPVSGTITVVPRSATTTTSTADTAGALTAAATASGLIAILGQLKQVGSNGRRLSSQLSGAGATKDVVGKGNDQHGANDQQAAAGDEAATSRAPAFILPAAPPPSPDPGAMAPSKITPHHLTYHTPAAAAAAASALLLPSTVLPGTSAAATAAPSTSQSAAAATAALSMGITSPPHSVYSPLTSNMITEAIMAKSFQYPSYPSTSSASVPHLHLTADSSGSALLSFHSNAAPGIGSNGTRIVPSVSRQGSIDAAQPPTSAPLASSSVDRQVHNVAPPLKAPAAPMGGTALAAPSSTASSSRNSSVHTLTQPFKGSANIKDSVGVSSTAKLTVEDVLKKLKVEREQQQAAGRRYKQYSVHGHRDTAAAAATCRGAAGKAVSSRRPSIAAPLLAVQELSNGAVSMDSLLIPISKRVTSTLSSKHQGGISEHGAGLTTSSKKDNVYIPPRRLSLVKQPSGLGDSGCWEKDGEVIKDQFPQHHASNSSRSPVVQVRPFTASAEAVAAELASSWSNIGLNPKPAASGECDEKSPFQPWSLEPSSLTVTSMAKKMSRGSHQHDFVTPAVNVIKSTAPAANDNDTEAKHAVFTPMSTPVMRQHLYLDPEDAFGGFREGEVLGLQHLHSIAAPGAGEEEASLHSSQSLSSLHGWCSGRVLHNTVEDHGNGRMPTLDIAVPHPTLDIAVPHPTLDIAVPHPSGSDQVLSSDDSSLSLQAALDMEPHSQMTQQHPLHKVDQMKGSDQGASPTPMLLTLQALSPALHRSPSRTAALRYNQQQESSADSTPSTQQQLPLPKRMQPEGFRHEAKSLASLSTQTPNQRILHDDHFAAPASVITPFSWMVEEAELAASLAVAAATSKRSMQHVEVPSSPTLFSSSLVVSTKPASQSTPSLSASKITFSTPSSSTLTTPATGLNYSTPQDDNYDERYSEISSASGPAAVLQSKLHELHSKTEPSTDSARAELSGWQNEGMLTRASLIVAQEAVGTVLSSLKSGPGVHTSGYIKSGYPTEGFVKRVPGVSSTLFNSSDMLNRPESRIVNHVKNHDIVLELNGFAKGAGGAISSSVMHKGRDDTSGIAEDQRVATAQLLSKLSSMNANTILMRKHMESSMGK